MSLLIGPFYYYILPVLQADCAHKMVIDRALVSFTSLVAHNTTETTTVHSKSDGHAVSDKTDAHQAVGRSID